MIGRWDAAVLLVVGILMNVGCDGVIGSGKRVDKCGVCDGDNTTCRIVSGIYTRLTLSLGYNLVAKIPKGACSLNITELRLSQNQIALRAQSGEFIINGNWTVSLSGNYPAVGTLFEYRRHDLTTMAPESVRAEGPLAEAVDVMLVYQNPNPGIKYEYILHGHSTNVIGQHSPSVSVLDDSYLRSLEIVPRLHQERGTSTAAFHGKPDVVSRRWSRRKHRHSKAHHVPGSYQDSPRSLATDQASPNDVVRRRPREYRWRVSGYSECSKSCGGGIQETVIICTKRGSLIEVGDHHCDPNLKPATHRVPCNTQSCHSSSWSVGPWSSCSVTCGQGLQTREVICNSDLLLPTIIDHPSCPVSEKPPSTQTCSLRPCAQWKTGPWTKCSSDCGKGIRRRRVYCYSADSQEVNQAFCGNEPPPAEETCDSGPCGNIWFASSWSDKCSATCGKGVLRRRVFCSQGAGCDPARQPAAEKPCSSDVSCGARWFTGPWSTCGVTCGKGVQRRDVICLYEHSGRWHSGPDSRCAKLERPVAEKACTEKPCIAEWFVSEWSQCSRACGTGVQTREVTCVGPEDVISQDCPLDSRPDNRQPCNSHECGREAAPVTPDNDLADKDTSCNDKYINCGLVVRARLCSYAYYRDLCCSSCQKTHDN